MKRVGDFASDKYRYPNKSTKKIGTKKKKNKSDARLKANYKGKSGKVRTTNEYATQTSKTLVWIAGGEKYGGRKNYHEYTYSAYRSKYIAKV